MGRRADPSERSPGAYSTALEGARDAHGQRSIRNGIAQLQQELHYADTMKVTWVNGVPRHAWMARLQARIAEQETELAAGIEAEEANEAARRERLAEADRQERATGPPTGHVFFGDGDGPERFDAKGRPVERMGRRALPSDNEAA